MRQTVAAYAALAGVTRRTVINWIHRGKLIVEERRGTGPTEKWWITGERFKLALMVAELEVQKTIAAADHDRLTDINARLDEIAAQAQAIPQRTPDHIEPPTEPLRYVPVEEAEQPPADEIDRALAEASRQIDRTFDDLRSRSR